MSLKISSHRVFIFVSFLLALFGLTFFSSIKIPYLSSILTPDLSKSLILVLISALSLLFYLIYMFFKREILVPENKLARILFLAFPILILVSSFFSKNISDSLFGKYVYLQSALSLICIVFLTYLLSSYSKISKRLSWVLFVFGNLLVTVPVMLGIIFSRFGLPNTANKIVYLVDSWDVVAAISGMFVVIALVYFETIAFSKKQKIIIGIMMALHLIIMVLILIPDVWFSLLLASFAIFLIARHKKNPNGEDEKPEKKVFYKQYSFYVFIISLILTVFLSISSNFTNKIVTKLGSFSSTYTGVSYNFIKPKINISLGLGFSELRHGKIFGSGPISFYQVWQKEKPQSVINSNFWGTDFTSSYSTFTTLFVTLGIFAALLSLLILGVILFSIWKKLKKSTGTSSYLELDEENKFYLLASSASFIFSAALFLFFSNVSITLVLLAISTGLILSNSIKWKEEKVTKTHFAIFALLFIFVLIGLIMIMNRVRATSISSNSIKNYQVDQNINKLENGLLRAARISNDDSDYRLLSQFYIFKTQQLLNSQATNTELLQKEVVDSINNGIATAKAAINLGKEDYNNYTTLGSVYSFLMTVDKENREVDYNNAKEAYNKAYSLYPKNPSIFLSLANLEYAYSKNLDFTAENLKKSLEIKPNYSSAFYLFSQLAVEANDKDSAINYAAQAIQADSQNVDAYLQYGILILNKKELNQEELNQAYTAFMSVLNLDRNNLTAAYYLSVTYILAQDYNNADQIIAALEKVLPDDQRIVDLRKFLQTSKASTPQNIATATTTKKK